MASVLHSHDLAAPDRISEEDVIRRKISFEDLLQEFVKAALKRLRVKVGHLN